MDTALTITDLLAFWGAIISTILGTIKILEFIRDRARIIVRAVDNQRVFPKETAYGDKLYIRITAANRGRRPIVVTTAFLAVPLKLRAHHNATHMICMDPTTAKAAVTLGEGQSHMYMMLQDGLDIDRDKFVAGVCDATGKTYYSVCYLKRVIRLGRIKNH